ncbi:MAG TPA: endo-1,3-alpha-glucanase family glycosylhydrolase [Phototrophicaceae bacterium]|nr:endo-1,3-alpha-glucanase family glycosylhydrolase [Phototrophicaceae bacterium]
MRRLVRVFMTALTVVVIAGVSSSAQPVLAQGRQVWAYYFGWYTGDTWGDSRLTDRPANPYDSRDGGTLGRQIDEAKSSGIDAFITSWFGPKGDNLTNQNFNALLDQAAARGFQIGASVDMQESGYNATIDEVLETLRYLINDRANHGAYLRYDGKPVIYFWNQARFSVKDWQSIRDQVDPNRNTIWVAEGTSTKFIPVFDGLYLFNTAWAANPGAVAAQWMRNVQNAGGWFYTPTVLPGWDESRIAGRDNPTDPQARSGNDFLTRSWNGAAGSSASVILIVSWNEYFENSYIEPSQNFGAAALDTLRPLVAAWESGQAAAPPAAVTGGTENAGAPANAPAPGTPTGITMTITNNVRFRSAPDTNAAVLGNLAFDTTVDVVGRTADGNWIQINYQGTSGWVSSKFGQLSDDLQKVPVTG